ncbi:RNA exonuclease prage isoform X1 [Musca autumnalis]|uniref:RNA exonuclease prage isoform X1 n=1 Tax=Musca autumnalis TaxID=221902 RepID=UPI003CF6EBFC
MNLNQQGVMFVPNMNGGAAGGNPNTNNIMMPGAGGAPPHFMAGPPPPHPHGHPNAMYHMRQMVNYPRFMGQSPPQRSGFSYYHHHHHHQAGPRHFYNPATMMMQHPRSPLGNGIFNNAGMWTQNKHNFPIPAAAAAAALRNTNNGKDINTEQTTTTSESTFDNETTNEESSTTMATLPGDNNNKSSITKQQPQQQQQPASTQQQSKKSDKIDKVLNKSLTKLPKIKRSDSKLVNKKSTTAATLVVAEAVATVTSSSSPAAAAAAGATAINELTSSTSTTTTSATVCVKIINKDMKQREQQKKKNDTMQRNSSKASHTSSSSTCPSNNNNKSHSKDHHSCHISSSSASTSSANSKTHNHDSSDSGISTTAGGHHNNNSSSKQRKSRGNNKRQDGSANSNGQQQQQQQKQTRGSASTSFTVNDWLQNDMYCFERRYIASCAEDSMIASRHNPAHRNSTSSEAAGSDDLNTSSSNEDLSSAYIVQNKTASKKSSKSRQKRQQKRKQNNGNGGGNNGNTSTNTNNHSSGGDLQPMDIDEEYKENHKPQQKPTTGNNNNSAAINLRKQCTKAAALKAVLNNSKLGKLGTGGGGVNALTTSPSNSSVCSSLSSASSTTSISSSSLSSSASSSPAHSANSSPTASPTASKRNADHLKKVAQALAPPLRQFVKLNLSESELVQQMRRYIIDPSLLRVYGFPVESVHHEGCIEIYKCLPKHLAEEAVTKDNQRHHRHYYGRKKTSVINSYDGLSSSQQWSNSTTAIDSGHGSGDSSPRFTDSDSSEMGEDDMTCGLDLENPPVMAFYTPDGVYQIFSEYDNSVEKQCVRCSKMFEVNSEGEYLTFEPCTYHWGKANNVYNGKCYVNIYSCCQGEESSEGCSQHPLHVWNGSVVGINGPYNDFVHTKPRSEKAKPKHPKIYAIDCEMSYTGLGLEVTKVTVVGYDGSLVYEHFVRPQAEIIDYNTRFSGITEKDLSPDSNNSIKTFAQVQQDLLKLFDADTILIGHGLDNDLRVLRLVHKTIVDTSLIFSHSTGYPYRRSLKNLTKSFLKRDIQCSDSGHSSFEDSRACLELMLWKVRKDLRHWSYQ